MATKLYVVPSRRLPRTTPKPLPPKGPVPLHKQNSARRVTKIATMSDPGDGLLAISLSDSDDQSAARPDARPGASRTGQSSEAFEAVKRGYVAKVEEGEVSPFFHLVVPFLPPGGAPQIQPAFPSSPIEEGLCWGKAPSQEPKKKGEPRLTSADLEERLPPAEEPVEAGAAGRPPRRGGALLLPQV